MSASTLDRTKKRRWWPLLWRPLLDTWIDIGFVQIHTALWRDAVWNGTHDYVVVEARLLRKWGFRFRLYQTEERIVERG